MENFSGTAFQGLLVRSVFEDRSVGGSRQMNGRRYHGFIVKMQGATEYFDGQRSLTLSEGEVLLAPKNSVYSIREVNPGYSCVINFDGCEEIGGAIAKLPVPAGLDAAALAERVFLSWQKADGMYAVLSQIYTLLDKSLSHSRTKHYISPSEKQLLEPAMEYLLENLTNPALQIGDLAKRAGVSDTYLRNVFKKKYGVTPAVYLTRERMRLARNLLESGEARQMQAVAQQVGYRDPLYFSRTFRKQFGLSPTAYYRKYVEELF